MKTVLHGHRKEQLARDGAPNTEPECVIRQAARVLVVSPENQLLLFQAEEPASRQRFWITPGGGVEAGETFQEAAIRECHEETGLMLDIGPCVWTRRHRFVWNGVPHDQMEQFFFVRTASTDLCPLNPDTCHCGERWWSLDEIVRSSEVFTPRRLARFLPPLLDGHFPAEPIDCGV